MAYSTRFFHCFNNGNITSCWDNFPYFDIGPCKEGYTKEVRIIRIRRIIQNKIYPLDLDITITCIDLLFVIIELYHLKISYPYYYKFFDIVKKEILLA